MGPDEVAHDVAWRAVVGPVQPTRAYVALDHPLVTDFEGLEARRVQSPDRLREIAVVGWVVDVEIFLVEVYQ